MGTAVRVYICAGCGIQESLDIPRLQAVAEKEYGALVGSHPHLCGPEGVEQLRRELASGDADRVVIAACSQRVNWDVFSLDSAIVERVNLREQAAWCHTPGDEETQALAEDQLRMGIVKVKKTERPDPFQGEIEKTILVVGGGIAGLTAALEAAEAGRDVVLIEQQSLLGGKLTEFALLTPSRPPYRDPEVSTLGKTIAAVQSHPRIRVLLSTRVEAVAGQPGAFEITARQEDAQIGLQAGAIVLSTGWQPYDASALPHLGFGRFPDVITSLSMEGQMKQGALARPSDGKTPRRVAFVQCAGSRDEKHLPYCSTVCCQVSLKQAQYVRQLAPDADVFILHKDIRTPGQTEELYRRVQEDDRVFFLRGEVAGVDAAENGGLAVTMHDTQLGEAVQIEADLVVLATGMVPAGGKDVLNLQYRQGPHVPGTHHDFLDSNFICWPYESQRTGIFTAGCVREPMGVTATVEDASGAGLRAVQAISLLGRGEALHPRVGDRSLPSFFLQRCTQCKRCTEECPFGALNEDVKGTPQLNPNRCRRCGVCMGACPERIVSFKDYSIDQVTSMIKAIEVPEDEDQQRILVLACENDAYPALDMVGRLRATYDASFRIIPLRCLGSTNVVFIADAMSRGIDGVLLLGCKHGDDYQCHFIKGSELANRRMENVRETLSRLRVEPERVRLEQLTISDYGRLPQLLRDFAAELREIGPNPYKGF